MGRTILAKSYIVCKMSSPNIVYPSPHLVLQIALGLTYVAAAKKIIPNVAVTLVLFT